VKGHIITIQGIARETPGRNNVLHNEGKVQERTDWGKVNKKVE